MDLQQLDFDLPVPSYAHPGDAGLDLYATEPAEVTRETVLIPTGVAVAVGPVRVALREGQEHVVERRGRDRGVHDVDADGVERGGRAQDRPEDPGRRGRRRGRACRPT